MNASVKIRGVIRLTPLRAFFLLIKELCVFVWRFGGGGGSQMRLMAA